MGTWGEAKASSRAAGLEKRDLGISLGNLAPIDLCGQKGDSMSSLFAVKPGRNYIQDSGKEKRRGDPLYTSINCLASVRREYAR